MMMFVFYDVQSGTPQVEFRFFDLKVRLCMASTEKEANHSFCISCKKNNVKFVQNK